MSRQAIRQLDDSGAQPRNVVAQKVLRDGLVMARALGEASAHETRLSVARGFTYVAMEAFWRARRTTRGSTWDIHPIQDDIERSSLSASAAGLARSMGAAAAELDGMEAGYALGVVYTTMMPSKVRADFGAYYTPPALCERLLDMATEAGTDWRTARVLDPACGGGAFLAPVARRMAESLSSCSNRIALKNIVRRLRGFELDAFSAWMSHVFLEDALFDLCLSARTRLREVVSVCNSLTQQPDSDGFDLVIGNPPYGRVSLDPSTREKYRRSLFGHANLYGVFTDLALRFACEGGVVAYVTPTSFLSGEYYKALRNLLAHEAPPVSIDFVTERKGIFADVLQETLLATYRRGGKPTLGQVHFIKPKADGQFESIAAGSFRLPKKPGQPWLVPRTKVQSKLIRSTGKMRHRLADYGYKVSTGPLVWNRHKHGLRGRGARGFYPLIWAESVRPDGVFEFRAERRNHAPYFEPLPGEQWVVTDVPCVLLQRTTAKEQSRRLVAAELPASFVKKHGAVVIENHLNMIRPIGDAQCVSVKALVALMNTETVDRLFRCISGSVAVSAYELEALPLPSPEEMREIERLVSEGASRSAIEHAVGQIYGAS